MYYLHILTLFLLIQKLIIIRTEHNSKLTLAPNYRRILELDASNDDDYLLANSRSINKDVAKVEEEEGLPFQRYEPIEENPDVLMNEKQTINTRTTESSGINEFNATRILNRLKKKFQEHRFTLSPTVVCIIICSTIIITCCCTIWLRNRIIACFEICWPSKKKREYDSLDSESGQKDTKSKLRTFKQKYTPFPPSRAKSLSEDYTQVETVDNIPHNESSAAVQEKIIDTPPSTSCCGICTSKKKYGRNN